MADNVKTTQGHMTQKYMKRTAGLIGGAVGRYFKDAMPVASDIIEESASTINDVSSRFRNITSKVLPKARQLKTQSTLRSISKWFLQTEDDFDDMGRGLEDTLQFDVDDTNSAEIASAQISEQQAATNAINANMAAIAGKTLEANMELTANILTTIDNQTAVMTKGFNTINDSITKLTEILTKNTAAMIEAQVASAKEDMTEKMLANNKFSMSTYKKMVSQNLKNSEFGMLSVLGSFMDPTLMKQMITPEAITEGVVKKIIDKRFPKLKENLKVLNDELNDTIMGALIGLGDNQSRGGLGGILRHFGIKASRNEVSTSRSSMELKAVPFDTVTKEAIVKTIPGYLQKILVKLGGEDTVYDYRTRQFRTTRDMRREFLDRTTVDQGLSSAKGNIRNAFGNSQYADMLYNMIMTDLGEKQNRVSTDLTTNKAVELIRGFQNPAMFHRYVSNLYKDHDVELTAKEKEYINAVSKNIADQWATGIGSDLRRQVATLNNRRNQSAKRYIDELSKFDSGIEGLESDYKEEIKHILRRNGMIKDIDVKSNIQSGGLSGTSYTNNALYNIYRKLDQGINVYVVGQDESRKKAFTVQRNKFLKPPAGMRQKVDTDDKSDAASHGSGLSGVLSARQSIEIPTVQGPNGEEQPGGFKEKIKAHGGALRNAILSGSPEDVRNAFGNIAIDIGEVAKDKLSEMAGKLNDKFGNVSGFLKHKLLGTAYSYTDENGNVVQVKENEKGGVVGFVKDYFKESFTSIKSKAKGWLAGVAPMFKYEDSDEEQSTVSKRNKLITSAVGAFAGAGILGGPIGMLVGGIMGSALSGLGLGKKVKNLLFGRDKETGKAKGILTKVSDAIVDPIKFQIGKTAHAFAGMLRKNIIGPLTNIGAAIRERIKNSAETHFGKAFSAIGKILLAQFKAAKKLITLPFRIIRNLTGSVVRGTVGAATGAFGGVANTFAKIIAGKQGRSVISERIKAQKQDNKNWNKYEIDENGEVVYAKDENGEMILDKNGEPIPIKNRYSNYKDWKAWKNAQRAKLGNKLKEYTAEHIKTPEEIADEQLHVQEELLEEQKKQNEKQENIEAAVQNLDDHGSHLGSIYVHDEGIHKRLDEIIDLMGGDSSKFNIASVSEPGSEIENKKPLSEKLVEARKKNSEETSNAILQASASLIGDGVTREEEQLGKKLAKEAVKEDSNQNAMLVDYTRLMSDKEKAAQAQEEKESSIWDKLGNLKDILKWGGILAAILAGIDFLSNIFSNWSLKETLKHIADNVGTATKTVVSGDDSDETDTVTEGMNAATALVDARVKDKYDWANPFGTIYHNDPDASGEWIKDQGKSNAKFDYQLGVPLKQAITSNAYTNLKATRQYNTLSAEAAAARKAADQASVIADQKQGTKYGQKYQDLADEKSEIATNKQQEADAALKNAKDATSHRGSELAHNVAKNYARVGVMSLAGSGAGSLAEWGLEKLGFDEETARKGGEIATRGTVAALTINSAVKGAKGKTSIVDGILDMIGNAFNWLAKKFKTFDKLKKFASKIDDILDNIYNKTIGKLTNKIATTIAQKLSIVTGKAVTEETISAITLGLGIAVSGLVGLISGYCGTEYLFGVLPGKADGTMKAISSILRGTFEALEATPGIGLFVVALDVLDEFIFKNILIDKNGLGHTLKSYLAMWIYGLLKGESGEADLAAKQLALKNEKDYYNETYDADVDLTEFNDMVNNSGLLDKWWRGKRKYDSNGHIKFDAAGGSIDYGISGFISGSEKKYVTDAEGNVRRTESGVAIVAKDKYGNTVLVDDDAVSESKGKIAKDFNTLKRYIFGGDVYLTDEQGIAIVDENGEYVIDKAQQNFVERLFDSEKDIGEGLASLGNSVVDGVVDLGTGFKDAGLDIVDSLYQTGKDFEETSKYVTEQMEKGEMGVGGAIWEYTKTFMGGVGDFVASLGAGVVDIGRGILEFSGDIIGGMTDAVGSVITSLGHGLGDMIFGYNKDDPTVSETERKYSGFTGHLEAVGDFFDWLFNGGPNDKDSPRVPFTSITNNNNYYGTGGPEDSPLDKKSLITSPFGKRKVPKVDNHKGIDLVPADGSGSANISSTAYGTVSYVKDDVSDSDTARRGADGRYHYYGSNSGGNQVWIDTDNGYRIKNMHIKADSIPKEIKAGSRVAIGSNIGKVGSTGWSTGPHLHYQIEDRYGNAINPMTNSSVGRGGMGGPGGKWVSTDGISRTWIPDLDDLDSNDNETKTDDSFVTPISNWKDYTSLNTKWVENYRYDPDYAYLLSSTADEKKLAKQSKEGKDPKDRKYFGSQLVELIKEREHLAHPEELYNTTSQTDGNLRTWRNLYAPSHGETWARSIALGYKTYDDMYKYFHPQYAPSTTEAGFYENVQSKVDSILKGTAKSYADFMLPYGKVYGLYYSDLPKKDQEIKYELESMNDYYRKRLGLPKYNNKNLVWDGMKYIDVDEYNATHETSWAVEQERQHAASVGAMSDISNPSSEDGGGDTSSIHDIDFSGSSENINDMGDGSTIEEEENKGVLNSIVTSLKKYGARFLSGITGGLYDISIDKDEEMKSYLNAKLNGLTDTSSVTYDENGNVINGSKGISGTNIERFEEVFITPYLKDGKSTYNGPGTAVKRFLAMCESQIGVHEDPAGSNDTPYSRWAFGLKGSDFKSGNAWYWCMAFVQWCFSKAGLPLDPKTGECRAYKNSTKSKGIYRDASSSKAKPGDVVLFVLSSRKSGDPTHVGIVEQENSDGSLRCIEGNINGNFADDFVNPNGSNTYGGMVAVTKRYQGKITINNTNYNKIDGYVTAVDFDSIDKILEQYVTKYGTSEITSVNFETGEVYGYSGDVSNDDLLTDNGIYTYLKNMGYSDAGVAGILGNWKQESGVNQAKRFKCVEGISDGVTDKELTAAWSNAGFDKDLASITSNRSGLTDYTTALLKYYHNNGYSRNESIYKPGNKYGIPGMGIAQWTGSRGKTLLDTAEKTGKVWYDPNLQMDLFKEEMQGKYQDEAFKMADEKLKSATKPGQAGLDFADHFEYQTTTTGRADSRDKRKKYSEEVYEKIKSGEIKLIASTKTASAQVGYKTKSGKTYDVYPWDEGWEGTSESYKNDWYSDHADMLPIDESEWRYKKDDQANWDKWIGEYYSNKYSGKVNDAINNVEGWYKWKHAYDGQEWYGYGGPDDENISVPFVTNPNVDQFGVGAPNNFAQGYDDHAWGDMAFSINPDNEIVSGIVGIGHAVHDENENASGGKKGDQTGEEVYEADWYNNLAKPWQHVFRAKKDSVKERIAKAMEQACANNKIGYNQNDRTSLFDLAKDKQFNLSKVGDSNTDCSALVATCVNAAGIPISKDMATSNEEKTLQNSGEFDEFSSDWATQAPWYLERGDILHKIGHTAVVLSPMSQADKMRIQYLKKEFNEVLGSAGGADEEPYVPFVGGGTQGNINKIERDNSVIDLKTIIANGLKKRGTSLDEVQKMMSAKGGPDDFDSEIIDTKYIMPSGGPESSPTSVSFITGKKSIPITNENNYNLQMKETDLTGVLNVLNVISQRLQSIVSNTADSNSYLDALNNKDFVDSGLRSAISDLGKVKKPKTSKTPTNSKPSSTVTAIARG